MSGQDRAYQSRTLHGVARRLFWWISPDEALRDEFRFLAQVMALGTREDVEVSQSVYPAETWKEALSRAPAGVIDPRSWHFWHVRLGIMPVPALPSRRLS
ncbi:MAG: hypothetical protein RLZZ408_1281 [Verrucomicrobiota bacterium]